MKPDLNWILGQHLVRVEKKDYTWFFTLENGSIATESFWRMLTRERMEVSSEDDGQLFGLKQPVNAAEVVISAVLDNNISRYGFSEISSDLIIHFSNDVQLQFLTTSGGYESWRAGHENMMIYCLGGGGLSVFKKS